MQAEVNFFSTLRLELGIDRIVIDSEKEFMTIGELFPAIDRRFDKNVSEKLADSAGSVRPGAVILVNGKNILHLNSLNTKVYNNDRVVIFPPAAGG